MSFLSLAAFALAPLLPLVVLFYMLKLKRKREVIPSTLLWRRAVQDLVANSPFQKLRNNLLMWLQLLILAALIFSLARPVMRLSEDKGLTIILLIDQTASMKTVEAGGKQRIELAREAALKAIDGLGSADEMILLGFSNRTQIVQTLTGDASLLRNAVKEMEASDTEVNLSETAVILEGLTTSIGSEAVRQPRDNTKTILIGDGGLGHMADKLALVPNLEYVQIGEATGNLGIVAVDLRESFSTELERQIFASVANDADEDKNVLVDLSIAGTSVDVKETEVPANASTSVVFTVSGEQTGVAEVSLPKGGDPLAIDDIARVVIPPPSRMSILVVTKGNFFLEQALNVDPRVDLSRIAPTEYESQTGEYDLTVFDNCTAGKLGTGMYVFMNELPPGGQFKDTGTIDNPAIIDWNRVHPMMRYVNMDRVLVGGARKLTLPSDAIALVEAAETPLIAYQETESRQIIVVGFDIFKSYWPVDVSFPIFMANLVDFARRQGRGATRPAYATGSTIPLTGPKGSAGVAVKTPSGLEVNMDFAGATTAYLTETNEAGVYSAKFDTGETRDIAVNVLSERESDIEPVAQIAAGSRTIISNPEPAKTQQEIWMWLAAAAFVVLAIEWYIYCRRAWL